MPEGQPTPEEALSPAELAEKKYGVDISDDRAVLAKMHDLGGDTPKIMELRDLWDKYQKEREAA